MDQNENKIPEIQVECEKHSQNNHSSSDYDSDADSKAKYKLVPRQLHERRDSGSSIGEEEDSHELTEELREKIIMQAEFYFSDENLRKDGFLLKHVKRNKEGYVNLKLLASFKKMKTLSRDYKVIGEALKDSKKLVVNETGLKLRRVEPLPKELLDQVKVKHLVISKIPNTNPSMNFITDAFPKHKDDVVSVRIVKPGKKFPNDLQSHFSRHPELREEVVAVVEFESPEITTEALKIEFKEGSYKGMEVKLLELGPKQSKKKENGETASDTPVDSDASINSKKSKNKSKSRLLEVSGRDDGGSSSYASSSDGEFSSFSSCAKRYNRSRGNSPSTSPQVYRKFNGQNNSRNNSVNNSPNPSPKFSRKNQGTPEHVFNHNGHKLSPLLRNSPVSSPEVTKKKQNDGSSNSPGSKSPWMQRKLKEMSGNESHDIGSHKHLDIVRQPIGPDGSAGFANHPLKKYILVHAC